MNKFTTLLTCLAALNAVGLSGAAEPRADAAYHWVADFPRLPAGWSLGAVSGVATDATGNVLVFHRGEHPILVFDARGKFLRSFGDGMFASAHGLIGLFITPDQTLFVADGRANKILKMTLDGKAIASWGTTGPEPGNFQLPHGVTVAGDGAVYVSEITGKRVQKFVAN